jgi:hypothetical protein
VGVAHCAPSDDEESLPAVGCADVGRVEAGGFHLVTLGSEELDNDVQAESFEARGVLDDDAEGSSCCDESGELVPESAACAVEASSLACNGDVLAGEPATQDGVRWDVRCVEGADIGVPLCGWEVAGQDGPAVRVDLDLDVGVEVAGGLQA